MNLPACPAGHLVRSPADEPSGIQRRSPMGGWHSGALAAGLAVMLTGSGCVEMMGADLRYLERDEKHFAVSGKPDVVVTTFDGSIEIRPWDKPDVQVIVEKRGRDKEAVAAATISRCR
jgi:hypothetical protein